MSIQISHTHLVTLLTKAETIEEAVNLMNSDSRTETFERRLKELWWQAPIGSALDSAGSKSVARMFSALPAYIRELREDTNVAQIFEERKDKILGNRKFRAKDGIPLPTK